MIENKELALSKGEPFLLRMHNTETAPSILPSPGICWSGSHKVLYRSYKYIYSFKRGDEGIKQKLSEVLPMLACLLFQIP